MMNSTYHRNQTPHNIVINNIQSYNETNMDCAAPPAKLLHTSPLAVGVNFMQPVDLHPTTTTIAATADASEDDCANITSNTVVFDYRQIDNDNVHGKATVIGNSTATTQPNTIYITNSVSQQQVPIAHTQSRSPTTTSAINSRRDLPTVANTQRRVGCEIKTNDIVHDLQRQLHPIDMVQLHSSESTHQTHIYRNHDPLLQLQQGHVPILLPQQFAPQHFNTTSHHATEHTIQLQLVPPVQEIYIPATDVHCSANDGANVLAPQSTNVNKSQSPTVVLDRINICINNHYMDVANTSSASSSSGVTAASTKTIFNAQQGSPIIPAIQHKIIESNIILNSDDSESLTIVDEPDSTTTTTQTPPTTPENCASAMMPISTRCELPQTILPSLCTTTNEVNIFNTINKTQTATINQALSTKAAVGAQSTIFTPPTPPTPSSLSENIYEINEDVFIQRDDRRYYLGTIIDCTRQEYLVRFDDRSEQWCSMQEMRKLGGTHNRDEVQNQMCVVCKNVQIDDVVEVCDRCGRGYHRQCTTEVQTGNWLCKRCAKPMKIEQEANWQILDRNQRFCYCGKNKQDDGQVLNCCKCQTVYHIQCIDSIKKKPLRGDSFFVFCCLLCNHGVEFVRRLQMSWSDIVHFALFNLSISKSHQTYYHLIKDIWPFILKNRHCLPIPDEWMNISKGNVMEKIKRALKESSNIFVSGVHLNKDSFYHGLRHLEPPSVPKFKIHASVALTDELLKRDMKLKLLEEPCSHYSETDHKLSKNVNMERAKDIYEFCADDDTTDDEIPIKHIIEKSKRTGKAYVTKISKCKILKCNNDDNASDTMNDVKGTTSSVKQRNYMDCVLNNENVQSICEKSITPPHKVEGKEKLNDLQHESNTLERLERSSSKRKAFTISKPYKEFVREAGAKRYENSRICDSSSDENSNSSRGTSLDVIIPPPKNFLGPNNPFRIVTPKKNVDNKKSVSVFGCNGTMIKKSIFNTAGLNFSSRLAALKKAGIFPNLSTSDLIKAAGQPSTVRTIKRRLSAKDITIGPNQEIRRRRTRRISSNVEVISTTTINSIPSNLFPIHAKDINATHIKWNSQQHSTLPKCSFNTTLRLKTPSAQERNSEGLEPLAELQRDTSKSTTVGITHGRRLRKRPQKISPINSRRSSISGTSTYSNSSSGFGIGSNVTAPHENTPVAIEDNSNTSDTTMQDLKQSVNKYFGAVNRIESGEQFSIYAKRRLPNGQMQFLIEWGEACTNSNYSIT